MRNGRMTLDKKVLDELFIKTINSVIYNQLTSALRVGINLAVINSINLLQFKKTFIFLQYPPVEGLFDAG